jgi:hypothetical protein
MFGQMDPLAFETFLQGAISSQSAILVTRIGADLYASTLEPDCGYVLQAENSLVLAEMWRRRITRKLGQAQGETPSCKYETEARDRALEEAELYIFRLIGGDFASGIADTSHFDGPSNA